MFDVSIVLNLHNEARYLRRTMTSLEEAVRFAQRYDITFEIVAVLDRPDAATKAWIDTYDFEAFDGHQVIVVDNGSLGLSRNDGIAVAQGEYIATADGDDLVSFDMFSASYLTAKSSGPKTIVMAEYLFAFGDRSHLVRYFGTSTINRLAFFNYHPYISRIFAHRSLFSHLRYQDARLSAGFAYEDWQFNCEALALGYSFEIAKNTLFFYRQRPNSLLRSANSVSAKVIGWTRYFEPETFVRLCALDYQRALAKLGERPKPDALRAEFKQNNHCMELFAAANQIDSAIDPGAIDRVDTFSNMDGYLEPGASYYRLATLIGRERYSDVVLLPFLTTGGADKYIIDMIAGISGVDPSRRFLVLTGERFEKHSWLDRLPPSALFIDLYRACEGCPDGTVELMALRISQAMGSDCQIHVKSSVFASNFFRKFHRLLKGRNVSYFRFSDPVIYHCGRPALRGFNFDFISEYSSVITHVITDNAGIASYDCERIEALRNKTHILYAKRPTSAKIDKTLESRRRSTHRLLWASRLDSEKRPELIGAIAQAASSRGLDISIDVYGSAVLDKFDVDEFKKFENVRYKGGFDDFAELSCADYDAFLYTTRFDGLPNAILEAMAAGLPVIAPDVGGISEAVNAETGFLIENSPDDDVLVDRYVQAIKSLYDTCTDRAALGRNAVRLIQERHSEDVYLKRLAEIFGLPNATVPALAAEPV